MDMETELLTNYYVSHQSVHLLLYLDVFHCSLARLSSYPNTALLYLRQSTEHTKNGTLMVNQVAIVVVLPSKASIQVSHVRKGALSEDATMRERMVGAFLLLF
jgi:hypothetical protein